MSEPGPRRSILLATAGVAILTAIYLFQSNRNSSAIPQDTPQTPGLHRSNAIRRPPRQRRWRHGFSQPELQHDPTEQALQSLQERNSSGQSYGYYSNSTLLQTPDDSSGLDLSLLPSNLDNIYDTLTARHPDWTLQQRRSLRGHIQMMFVQNFLREEYPMGYILRYDMDTLDTALTGMGVDEGVVIPVLSRIDAGQYPITDNWSPDLELPPSPHAPVPPTDSNTDENTPQGVLRALGAGTDDDTDSDVSFAIRNTEVDSENQKVLDLLYHIGNEQAKRDGYIHRGVECNSCGACPIQGIRYHCANCFDYDLCETCENGQVHIRTHVFYKIRIPAPSRGHIKQVAPKWYPGNPNAFPPSLPRDVYKRLLDETGMDRTEVDALYEQFKCLAGAEYPKDPCHLGMAIDRQGFDLYFIPGASEKPTMANLIYDRIFAFYDRDCDGCIGFEEYLKGLSNLQNKSRMARLTRIFQGYDLDGDGYVERKDFLRMFRAYYALSKELNREMVNTQEDYGYTDEEIREVVRGSQPISAAFGGNLLYGHESRSGEDKQPGANGDLTLTNGPHGVLQNDLELRSYRARAIGNTAIGHRPRSHPFRSFRTDLQSDELPINLPMPSNFELIGIQHADDATEEELTGPDPPLQAYGWPPLLEPESEDIISALGIDIPLDEILDPVDRSRVFYAQSQRLDQQSDRYLEWTRDKAVQHRWKRRQFYIDEEEGLSKPQRYAESDSSDDRSQDGSHDDQKEATNSCNKPEMNGNSRRPSLRSRSSSKVRFDDSAIDTDYETRSNASSRSIPMNERWGGFELSGPEVDVGKDILYQAVQQGFNELLDIIFKEAEDAAMESLASRRQRWEWEDALREYEKTSTREDLERGEALRRADMLRTREMIKGTITPDPEVTNKSVLNPFRRIPGEETPPRDPNEHTGDILSQMVRDLAETENDEAQEDVADSHEPDSDNGEQENKYDPATASAEHIENDPTLPQFRPDGDENTKPTVKPDETESSNVAEQPEKTPPDVLTLAKWLHHKKIADEAHRRGGYGRLTFHEFRRKMIPEDEVVKALGSKGKSNSDGKADHGLHDGNDNDMGEEEKAFWESSADLGKLAFVGTWLEMASF